MITIQTEFPTAGISCDRCDDAMFISLTPSGADYTTCPICGIGDSYVDYNYDENHDFHYCDHCNIVYKLGCTHGVNGCTDDTYYAELVNGFKIGNMEYSGMPVFNSYKECLDLINNYELYWVCTCKGNCSDCPKSAYPEYDIKCHCENNLKHVYDDVESEIVNELRSRRAIKKLAEEKRLSISYNIIRMMSYDGLRYSDLH